MNTTEYQNNVQNQGVTREPGIEMIPAFHPLKILMRRRWQLFTCLLLVCGVALAATVFRKPQYEARARIKLNVGQDKGGSLALLTGNQTNDFKTQEQLLTSRFVLALAQKKLQSLDSGWASKDGGLEYLSKNIKVKPVQGSHLIDVIGVAQSAPEAAAIANEVTAAFAEATQKMRQKANNQLIAKLKSQIGYYDTLIRQQQDQIQQFRAQHAPFTTVGFKNAQMQISTIGQELTRLKIEGTVLQAKLTEIKNALSTGQNNNINDLQLKDYDSDGSISKLQNTIDELCQQEKQLSRVYLPGYDKLRSLRARIADLQAELDSKIKALWHNVYAQMQTKYNENLRQQSSLEAILNQKNRTGVQLADYQQKYSEMLANLESTKKFKNECQAQIRRVMLESNIAESPILVIDKAQIPKRPAGLSRAHQAASILLLGMLFSIVFVLSWDRFTTVASTPVASEIPVYAYNTVPMTTMVPVQTPQGTAQTIRYGVQIPKPDMQKHQTAVSANIKSTVPDVTLVPESAANVIPSVSPKRKPVTVANSATGAAGVYSKTASDDISTSDISATESTKTTTSVTNSNTQHEDYSDLTGISVPADSVELPELSKDTNQNFSTTACETQPTVEQTKPATAESSASG